MVACPRCDVANLRNVRDLINHVASSHSNEPHFCIACTLPKLSGNCCSVFHSYSSYKRHIHKFHNALLSADRIGTSEVPVGTEILCPVCGDGQPSLRAISAHFRCHCDLGVPVPCLVKHCKKVFDILSSYTAHMSKVHKNVSLPHLRDDLKRRVSLVSLEVESEPLSCDAEMSESHPIVCEEPCITQNIALLFLKMKTQYCLADSTVQAIADDFSQAFETSMSSAVCKIKGICSKYTLPDPAVGEICSATDSHCWKNAIAELSTNYKRNSYYKEMFPYVSPSQYKFTDDCSKSETFQYVSLLETLKVLLKNEDVKNEVLNPECAVEGHILTFKDGSVYKAHPLLSHADCGLEIILYSDEFQIVNPLGPHRKKHKLMAFYFTLGNLHSHSKAQKSAIFLLTLCKSNNIQKYGFGRIAEMINSEIAVLESTGIDIEGYPTTLFGSLAFIAGDNLNSHIIGG